MAEAAEDREGVSDLIPQGFGGGSLIRAELCEHRGVIAQQPGNIDIPRPQADRLEKAFEPRGELGDGRFLRFAQLAAFYPKISSKEADGRGGLRQAGVFVFNSVGATLSAPFTVM